MKSVDPAKVDNCSDQKCHEKFVKFFVQLRHRLSGFDNPRVRKIGIGFAICIFFIGLFLSIYQRPSLIFEISIWIWLWVFLLVPVTLTMNALQFWITARIAGLSPGANKVITITLMSTAANFLPVPGGSIIRVIALKKPNESFKEPVSLTVLAAMTWIGMSAAVASICLFILGFIVLALYASALGFVTFLCAIIMFLGKAPVAWCWFAGLLVNQLCLVAVGGVRLWLCLLALSEQVLLSESLVLVFSSVAAALAGFAPGGLGLTEALAAGLGVLIGVSPDSAFLATALNRVTGLLLLGPMALIILMMPVGKHISWEIERHS